ncbi:MAG: hypothetical protein E6G06_03925 [Actinobacteria bacterium]|nr:MAG: hypothetical protein E6G06_03925 [Actinomycetota bacterium]
MDVDHYRALVRPLVAGRKVVITGGPLAGLTDMVELTNALGAERPFALAFGVGTGDLPGPDRADTLVLDVGAPDIVSELRAVDAALVDLPAHALAALARYDPDHEAVVLVMTPFWARPEVARRTVLGPRTAASLALEDKSIVDDLWDALGVTRAAATVVPARADALHRAARRLDRGLGTVWSGDASEGLNGGGVYVRWVRSGDLGAADDAASFLVAHCRRVRVMPFLEGIPCSIHGLVFRDGVAVLRPVELITLRRAERPGAATESAALLYAGTATFWDPAPDDREEMRAVARRVGEGLRERIGFRGAFTVDGVMTAAGFRPTELNPRAGAGLVPIGAALPALPLQLLHIAARNDVELDARPTELERLVVEASDGARRGAAYTPIAPRFTETTTHRIVYDGTACRVAGDDEPADATVTLGPSNVGGFVRVAPDGARTPAGPSIAPFAVAAFALTDATWGTGIGPLAPAGHQ